MTAQELVEALRELDFCDEMDEEFLAQMAGVSQEVSFPLGHVIFREGEPARHMYLLRSGHVSLEVCAPGVGCKRILTLSGGDLLGWSPVLEQTLLTATARALEPTEAIELNAAQLLTMCEHSPRFGYLFMRRAAIALAKRLRATRLQLLNVYGGGMPNSPIEQT